MANTVSPKRLVALALPWLVACAAAPTPSLPEVPVEVTPVVTAAPAVEPEPEPEIIELPEKAACVLRGPWRGRTGTTGLFIRQGGRPFASVHGGSARLHFPIGAHTAVQGLEVEDNGIAVRGYIEATAVDLRAAKPFWINALALPTSQTRFDWTEGVESSLYGPDGELAVTTEIPTPLEVSSPPLFARRPCADFGMGPGSFTSEDLIDGSATAKARALPTDRAVDIDVLGGAHVRGQVVARARATRGQEAVGVLQVWGNQSRILWPVGSLLVVGWVATGDLQKPVSGTGYGSGHGTLGRSHAVRNDRQIVCAKDVQLVVEAGDEQAVAGVIRAGTVIEAPAIDDRFTPVVVRSQSIEPAEGARWMVHTTELHDCKSPP